MTTADTLKLAPIKSILDRDPRFKETDKSALRALAQAAINVELFTIPLYMTTLYSIQGMHEINGADQTFYKGRQWPGASISANPQNANEHAFNIIFSVFVQEMLHLQLAANLAATMGVTPSFTSDVLQSERAGWKCYGKDETVIPHVIDLRDTHHMNLRVTLRPLDQAQIELFLVIEQPEQKAIDSILPDKLEKYTSVEAPFEGWDPSKTETDLPLFGTIGRLYDCMATYMSIGYSDGTTLWGEVYKPTDNQRDMFNAPRGGHSMPEYPGISTCITNADPEGALSIALDIISAITDQGEGSAIMPRIRKRLARHRRPLLEAVKEKYQSSKDALEGDYPSYNADGKRTASAQAKARFENDAKDHYERFLEIKNRHLPEVVTWAAWHQKNEWKASDLVTEAGDEASTKIPPPDAVAGALNRLKAKNAADGGVHQQLSQVAAGAIAGVTRVLTDYWTDTKTLFPFPSMVGSGDRISICWAVLGVAPDLSLGIETASDDALYHACQGLNLDKPGANEMPLVTTFHTCKGSNACKGQGGCGFVQSVKGGGNCSGATAPAQNLCGRGGGGGGGGDDTYYSAPSDNKCGRLGGCAVPISASQLYPNSGEMIIFDIHPNVTSTQIGTHQFNVGDPVYETAWAAYCEVLKYRNQQVPSEPPEVDDLRLVFPPST
jgi:hypothetical protein